MPPSLAELMLMIRTKLLQKGSWSFVGEFHITWNKQNPHKLTSGLDGHFHFTL